MDKSSIIEAWKYRGSAGVLTCLLSIPCLATTETTPGEVADLDITELVDVRISPFEVAVGLDDRYRASNSVTASRFDAPIRELPFAIQGFTESFIKDQKAVTLFDVARYSPGVTYRSNDFNEGNANLAIRGFAVSSTPGGVQTLRDGFHGPTILDFTNISRVEIVKGPSSFLYGQVAPGGVVNVITKSPQRQYAASADVRYGSYDQYRAEADVTGPATGTLFYRVATSYDRDMHYWDAYDSHSYDVAPSLLWQPSDRVSLSLKYEYFHKNESPQLMQKPGYGTQAGVTPTPGDPNLSGVDVPGLADTWNSMSLTDYRLSNTSNLNAWLDLKASEQWDVRVGYSQLRNEIDALATGNFGMTSNSTLLQGRRVRRQTYTQTDHDYEAQAVGRYQFDAASLRLLFGAQYIDRRFDNVAGQAPGTPLTPWNLSDPSTWDRNSSIPMSLLTASPADQTIDYRDKSVYGGTTLGVLDDRLLLLAGLRRTSTQSQLTDRITSTIYPNLGASALTPQYGMLYKLDPAWSFFASYAESFVPGTFMLKNPDGTTSVPKPTQGKGYDIGFKADLPEHGFSGTFTLFDLRNRNVVNDLSVTSGPTVYIYNVQSGEQRSRGLELDATLTHSDRWQTYVSYSYMKARITEFSGNDAAILAQDPATLDAAGQANYKNVLRFHNAPLQMSAPHLANLWTRCDLADGYYAGGGFNYVYDQTLLPDTPSWAHQTYLLVNAMTGYAWKQGGQRMSLDLTGKNLTNRHYRPSQSSRSRPREFILTLSIRF
jgi:iron complex outermembrane receptor protein